MPPKNSANRFGWWVDYLVGATDHYVHAETTDGLLREGRISGFTFRSFELNGSKVEFPEELEINGDPNDRLPLDRVRKLKVT